MGSLSGIGFFLFAIPALIAQWIGVVKLSKHGRGGEWWWMLAGTALTTLGPILQLVGALLMGMTSSGSTTSLITSMIIFGGFSPLGALLFTIGFAIHASRLANL